MATSNITNNQTGQTLYGASYQSIPSGYSVTPPAPVTPTGGSQVVNPITPSVPVSPTTSTPKPPVTSSPTSTQVTQPTTPSSTIPQPVSPLDSATNKYLNDTAANNSRIDQLNSTMQTKLDQFTNGTVPLNQYEQSQIDATKESFNQIIQAQKLANQNYEGGVTVTNQTQGLSKYSPEMAAGNTLAAVSEGLQKIAALNVQMNQAVAQMRQGFQTNDYNMVKNQYDALLNAQKEKTVQIETVYNTAKDTADRLKTSEQEATLSYVDSGLLDPTMSLEDKKKLVSDSVYNGNLTSAQIKTLQDSLQQQIDNTPGAKPLTGLQGEYQYYVDQERSAGRSPLSFFDFKNYQTNATIGAGINPITGQPISKADQAAKDEASKQDTLDLQTVNSAYTSIEGILKKYNATPDTFTVDVANNMNDVDAESIAKAIARIQNPDIARMGGDAGNALSPTSVLEHVQQFYRATSGGKKYLPEKIVDAVGNAKSVRDFRQAQVDNPTATQATNDENAAQSVITNFVSQNQGQKEMIAKVLETPLPAFNNKPPTYLQTLEYLRGKGIIP